MRELTVNELSEVNGGEILVSPGQLGIALTNNTLIVITGTVEATTLMSAFGVLSAAAVFGYNLGSWLNDTFNLSSFYAELCWNITH